MLGQVLFSEINSTETIFCCHIIKYRCCMSYPNCNLIFNQTVTVLGKQHLSCSSSSCYSFVCENIQNDLALQNEKYSVHCFFLSQKMIWFTPLLKNKQPMFLPLRNELHTYKRGLAFIAHSKLSELVKRKCENNVLLRQKVHVAIVIEYN